MDTLAQSSEDLRRAPVTSNLCPECLEIQCACNGPAEDLREPQEKGATLVIYRDEFDAMQKRVFDLQHDMNDARQLFMDDRTKLERQDMVVYERTSTLLVLTSVSFVLSLISIGLAIASGLH